ncbi:MAG: DUF11 domain-containing protein, partial [Actinobacteria bacterium]|nr:DUF11 domain-containing protein [Actinomycetota bacterium]
MYRRFSRLPHAGSRRLRRSRAFHAVLAILLLMGVITGLSDLSTRFARASMSIAQTYYTPFEAQQFVDVLRGISGDPGCCSTSVQSTVSVTSGAGGNIVVYDHFEDGYEEDPFDPVQGSTVTLSLDAGDVWTQTSTVPIDQPGRGAGNYYDGRDRIVATAPIAVTQSGFATDPGTVHAGAVQVLDVDKSGLRFDIPIGVDANFNELFDYVGAVVVATHDGTTLQIDADADGSYETTASIDEGEVYVVDGGIDLGGVVLADLPVAVYLASGDIGATYEGRFVELYPTAIWSDAMVSPVGSHDFGDGRTRAFFFNPSGGNITIDVVTGSGSTATLTVGPGGQGSFVLPMNQGARFSSRNGEPFYGMQMITSEGTSTSAWDWGFTLIPDDAVTPSVIVPYGIGSNGGTHNYSPVWFAADADTRVYVDLDGDDTTGPRTDPEGGRYDYHCDVNAFESWNAYDDGQYRCYRPSEDANATGGGRDMTGARLYSLTGARLSSAWGQRPDYVPADPALDMGTTILPFPTITIAKTSVLAVDVDEDGVADAGDVIRYTMSMENLGIVDVGSVVLTDETPDHTTYVAGSTTLDAVPQSDDGLPYSASPLDADSPAGGLAVGTLPAGSTRVAVFDVMVDDPVPLGVSEIENVAVMTTNYGPSTASVTDPVDVPPLQIDKSSAPSETPVGAGDTVDYTIRVYAVDAAPQTGVAVTDGLPPGLSYVAGTIAADVDGTPVAVSAPPAMISGLTMTQGQLLTITFTAEAAAPLPAGITEFANIASAASDQAPTPISADATDPADPQADLWVLKDDNTAVPLDSGDLLTYTLTVGNDGPDDASAVTVVDTLPPDVTFDGGLSDPACAEAPAGTVTCSLGDLAAGASTSFDVVVDVDGGFVGSLTNVAVVSSPTPDPNPANDDDTEVTPVEAEPSLTVAKTPSTGSVPEPGGTVTFSVDVANPSAEALTLTSLVDDVFGDLLDGANPAVSNNTCDDQATAIPAGGTFSCSFDAALAGHANDPDHVDTVTAAATDGEGNTPTDHDSATVAFGDVPPTVSVSKTPSAGSVPETGATVTFAVEVANTSVEAVTLTSLGDDVFGDLLDGANPAVSANTCDDQATAIPTGGTFSCSFDAAVTGFSAGPDHVDTVTAVAEDDEGNAASDDGSATVAFTDVAPTISTTKTPSAGSVPEPGGTVTFTVEVANTSGEPVTLTSLSDDVFGDLLDGANPAVSANTCDDQATAIPTGGTFSCSFDAAVTGFSAGPDHVDTVTAVAEDDEGNAASDDGSATVAFTDVAPTISTTKTPSAGSVPEPGGTVTFTVEVANTSVEAVTLTSLSDDVFGDLLDGANPAVSANTCDDQPVSIAVGGTFSCSFDAALSGLAGDPDHVNTVTAAAEDGDGNTATDDGSATVAFGDSLPSITVAKTPSVGSVPETGGTVTFSVEVANTSAEPLTLASLSDDVFGDLLDGANPAVTANTCDDQGTVIGVGGTFACSFDAALSGDAGGPDHVDTVTAGAGDGEGNTATGFDSATVSFSDVAPSISTT